MKKNLRMNLNRPKYCFERHVDLSKRLWLRISEALRYVARPMEPVRRVALAAVPVPTARAVVASSTAELVRALLDQVRRLVPVRQHRALADHHRLELTQLVLAKVSHLHCSYTSFKKNRTNSMRQLYQV